MQLTLIAQMLFDIIKEVCHTLCAESVDPSFTSSLSNMGLGDVTIHDIVATYM